MLNFTGKNGAEKLSDREENGFVVINISRSRTDQPIKPPKVISDIENPKKTLTMNSEPRDTLCNRLRSQLTKCFKRITFSYCCSSLNRALHKPHRRCV